MEFLISNNPMIRKNSNCKSIGDYYLNLVEDADKFNIATGFVSNASIVKLDDTVSHRQSLSKYLELNLLIGMDYIEGFTKVQYEALKGLSDHLNRDHLGSIMISKQILYHGKMYSFVKGNSCNNAFLGSSNLGSFIGTTYGIVESDILFHGTEAEQLNAKIEKLFKVIGTDFKDIPEITDFKKPTFTLLNDNSYVKKVSEEKYADLLSKSLPDRVKIPLKTEKKSNLNAYFGAGKIKNKWSPRDWYEVEIIVSEKSELRDDMKEKGFPKKGQLFTVVTNDHYKFNCKLEGGNKGKNLRSVGDLRILGKWIKGHMEIEGKLHYKQLITPEILSNFGKSKLVFTKTKEKNVWLLKLA